MNKSNALKNSVLIGAIALSSGLLAGDEGVERIRLDDPPGLTNLPNVSVAGGFTNVSRAGLKVVADGELIRFQNASTNHVFRPASGYLYRSPVIDPTGRRVVFIVQKYEVIGKGETLYRVELEFHGVDLFDMSSATNAVLHPQTILSKQRLSRELLSHQARVTELGEFSADGEEFEMLVEAAYHSTEYPRRRMYFNFKHQTLRERRGFAAP